YLANSTGMFAVLERNSPEVVLEAGTSLSVHADSEPVMRTVWYLHKDQLGSVLALTDPDARVAARFWYDPWGSRFSDVKDRMFTDRGETLGLSWERGYTGHQHLQGFDLIHMNARVYDPRLGQFFSPDPLNSKMTRPDLLGGYRYAADNPL